jgi:hypothetical protein
MLRQAKEKASFCEQKEAKSFFKLGRAGFTVTGPGFPQPEIVGLKV